MTRALQQYSTTKNKIITDLSNRQTLIIFAVLLIAITIPTQCFCDPANNPMDSMTTTTINTIFSPWVRRTLLGFGAGFGLFQSIAGGSFKPLLTWGGLGLIGNYIPKLVEFLSTMGT